MYRPRKVKRNEKRGVSITFSTARGPFMATRSISMVAEHVRTPISTSRYMGYPIVQWIITARFSRYTITELVRNERTNCFVPILYATFRCADIQSRT